MSEYNLPLPVMTTLSKEYWDGCKCAKCGTTRDQDHSWSTAVEWEKLLASRRQLRQRGPRKNKVVEGDKSPDALDLERLLFPERVSPLASLGGCKCLKCGKTRDYGHVWSTGPRSAGMFERCSVCGKIRDPFPPLQYPPTFPPTRGSICLSMLSR